MKFIRRMAYFLCSLILLSGGLYFWLHYNLNREVAHDKAATYIVIDRGSSSNQIIAKLHQKGIIEAPLATRLYVRIFSKKIKMEAGDYLFPSPISPKEVLTKLRSGKQRAEMLTIPEGWTRFEIAERITARFPIEPPLTKKEVLGMMDDTRPIQEFDPQAESLEGYLYPTTYELTTGTHPSEIVAKMVQQFENIWQPEWDAMAKNLGRSRHEIVVIASLIENESKVESERPLVASVVYNRLHQSIPLGIDATNVYIAKLLNRWDGILHRSDLLIDHPYNTRRVVGLPPGPICSPSQSALEAALKPQNTDYIYYVLNVEADDGSHHFYADPAEFIRGKAAYQKWLARQRGE